MSSGAHNFEASTSAFILGSTTFQQNSKYKAYASAVDKALKSFESTTEWADLIAALGKLGKVFSSHAKTFNDIPNSLTVSKRLAQCLHPALPFGVHLKALETYRQVFLILGRTQNLARYLFLYAAGLFPLIDHCGIKVKSELLSIFEQFLLPLGPDVCPALPGLITALLSALEEGTEFYGRAFNLLDQLIEKVGSDPFYTCFWQAVSENPSARLPGLIFVNAKIEKRKGSNDFLSLITARDQASHHMLKALCAVAEDSGSPLVQRHLLDFLCTVLPLNSDHVSNHDLIQLLRRCIFVVLRRDMSLNRRLYQWLLNRSNDMTFAGLPVDGKENSLDLAFFKKHTLPLIKAAICEYLKADTVEIATPSTGTLRCGSTMKNLQTQFPEVRVCRLLHYMLDRPELGQIILEECLADLLETFCMRDKSLLSEIQNECEAIEPTFGTFYDLDSTEINAPDPEQHRREEEIRKNFNALLKSLEPNFIWNYFEKLFAKLNKRINTESVEVDFSLEGDEFEEASLDDNAWCLKEKQLQNIYPLILLYSIKNVQLDSHTDIRVRYLPKLLRSILSGIDVQMNFSFNNLLAVIVICRYLLTEITQNNVSIVFESIQDANESSPSKKNMKCNKDLAEEQKLVESSLEACLRLLSTVCEWYTENREIDKIGLLKAVFTLVRDFADFPFYSLQPLAISSHGPHSPCRSLTDSIHSFDWLNSVFNLIDPISWRTTLEIYDFDIRENLFELVLYLSVRSVSMIEQHSAVLGRELSQKSCSVIDKNKKTTTTVLLKPFLSQADMTAIEKNNLIKESASVLWERLSERTELARLHSVALLLLRLHSRRTNDPSSEVEDIIVSELTSGNKMLSGDAARKFRELWVFCRSSQIEEVYSGIPLKPMNRVVMVLIGFIADESTGAKQVELQALAYSWFQDCARNNDLPKILQMLTLILLNPKTARVSIQFVQLTKRITKNEVQSLPEEINCVSLSTINGKKTFNHVCKDVDTQKQQKAEKGNISPIHYTGNSWSDYKYINCDPKQTWVSELNRHLLLPSNDNVSVPCHQQKNINSMQEELTNLDEQLCQKKTHNRTLSDIPQFDNDVESMDSFSLDTSFEQDVVDVLQYLIDTVCEGEEENECKSSTTTHDSKAFREPSYDDISDQIQTKKNDVRQRYISSAQEADEISVVGSLITPSVTAAALPRISGTGDTIKRIRTGHRRQDSLQESIFSTGTQELHLFDPTELPNSTCPGDYKQPLLDETFSHMLFYAESPSMVDLILAEKLFRTVGTLLKSGVRRQIVSCMLFTNIYNCISSHGENASIGAVSLSISQQLLKLMARHYRHIQGDGFWDSTNEKNSENADYFIESKNQKFSTLFEIFSTVVLYFFRSYFLNSPTNYVSEDDLIVAWKCKIAALDCFAELLHILDGIVHDASSKEFAIFVQHIYRQTKAQKVVLTLMLAAIPTPTSRGWKMPLTMDIGEFNNGPQNNGQFRDLIYAYHRSLLNLASSLVTLEHSLLIGIRFFSTQISCGIPSTFGTHQITENQINYNSPQNRSTIREARYSVVELRLFLSVILNALKRCPDRHELWLQFVIKILPYLDRALATFVVHITEQICRNLYDCLFLNGSIIDESWLALASQPIYPNIETFLEHTKNSLQFSDYRITHPNGNSTIERPIKYPANYILILMDSLMSVLHFSTLDNNLSFLISPQMLIKNAMNSFPSFQNSNPTPNRNSTTIQSTSSNMTSMVGSAISVIPGTGLINNLFGRVFTSGDSTISTTNGQTDEDSRKTPEWLEAQQEMLKRIPSVVAILSDIWSYVASKNASELRNVNTSIGTYKALAKTVLEILNPFAKKHTNILVNALGIVWMFRANPCMSAKNIDQNQYSFIYSSRQTNIAKLMLRIKALSLNSIILSISETFKEIANKSRIGERANNSAFEVALLELLHECTRQVSMNELKESWNSLIILFNESPLTQLPAKATFLEFKILTDFVRRCGAQTILEDRNINKAILDICQRLVESVNSIIGWQLESTTWLKRTLVVRQDASSQKPMADMSPVLDQKGMSSSVSALSASALPSEANSIRDSTISLSGIPPSRLSTALDIQSSVNGIDAKKNPSLRSSLKESGNKKDPSDSTKAIFLLAENLPDLVDSITRGEDKEKLLPTMQSVWNNTLPYLKSKSAKNVRSFLASSQLLASISSYNYMRPVWKKNAMELLWDNAFFKMDIHALKQWLNVIDNLMTNDKTSFKELLARITTSTSTTFSTLITSKEQEYEMRSQYLKRLAFVVMSSNLDQYNGQLNEIQERLTENLRLCQAPIIHTQVFTCYRVILIRMSSSSFVSIWPSMITELIQVLAQIEQHLCTATHTSVDDQKSVKEEQTMQLFLACCKLLETLFILPPGHVSQFQMCRWAFIAPMKTKSLSEAFLPYSFRINNLLTLKYGELTKEDLEIRPISLFNVKTLTSLQEIQPFFFTLAQQNEQLTNGLQNGEFPNDSSNQVVRYDGSIFDGNMSLKDAVARIENSLYVDFAEHWQL